MFHPRRPSKTGPRLTPSCLCPAPPCLEKAWGDRAPWSHRGNEKRVTSLREDEGADAVEMPVRDGVARSSRGATFGWHYLSEATCLIRPHLFYARFVVSRTIIIRYIICNCYREPVLDKSCLDKWLPLRKTTGRRGPGLISCSTAAALPWPQRRPPCCAWRGAVAAVCFVVCVVLFVYDCCYVFICVSCSPLFLSGRQTMWDKYARDRVQARDWLQARMPSCSVTGRCSNEWDRQTVR